MRKLDKDGNPIQEVTSDGVQTVGAEPTMKYTERVIDTTRKAVYEAIKICRPGVKFNKIGETIEKIAAK